MRKVVLGLAVAFLVLGCAKKNGDPAPAAAPAASIQASSVGLDLRGPSSDDELVPAPDGGGEGQALPELAPAYVDSEIIFQKSIILTATQGKGSAQALFFTWPETAGSYRVVDGFFSVRTQDAQNQLVGQPVFLPVSFDPATQRYFVPLARLLQAPLDGEQVVQFRLGLDHGGTTDLTLRFRVTVPLQPPTLVSEVPFRALAPFFERAGMEVPLRNFEYVNSTDRDLKLWVRAEPTTLQWTGVDLYSWTIDNVATHQTGSGNMDLPSTLRFDELQVSSRGATSRTTLGPNWFPVQLPAHQRVDLAWTAHSAGCGVQRGGDLQVTGQITAVRIVGAWKAALRLTDSSIAAMPDDFAALPVSQGLDLGTLERDESSGPEVPVSAQTGKCQ
jgi:hypothetical protein